MPEKPDDRPKPSLPAAGDLEPRLYVAVDGQYVIVDGQKQPRPGLDTYFASAAPGAPAQSCTCNPVVGVYCQCNKVKTCSCVPVATCACVGYSSCSCDSHSSGGGSVSGCRCAPVH